MCSTAAARHVARPGRARLPRQPSAVTRSYTAPHVPLQAPAPTENLWAGTEGCVGFLGTVAARRLSPQQSSGVLLIPHRPGLPSSRHSWRKPFARGGAGPALLLSHTVKGPVAAGRDKPSPFSQEGRVAPGVLSLDAPHQSLQQEASTPLCVVCSARVSPQLPCKGHPSAAQHTRHGGAASSPLRLLQSHPPPTSGAAAMQKEHPRCRLAQAQLPPRAGRGGGCRP